MYVATPQSGMGNAATAPTTTTKQQQQFGSRAATRLAHQVAAALAIATATAATAATAAAATLHNIISK